MSFGDVVRTIGQTQPNLAINGGFDNWQRGVGPVNCSSVTQFMLADRFQSNVFANGTWTTDRVTDAPNSLSTYSLRMNCTAGNTPTSSDNARFRHIVEGLDVQQLANYSNFTVSFWFKAGGTAPTGTYSFMVENGNGGSQVYVLPFTVSSLNAWKQYIFTIPFNASAITTFGAGVGGLGLNWFLSTAAGLTTSNTGQWISSATPAANGQVNGAVTGATFQIAQVQLSPGVLNVNSPFVRAGVTAQQELAMCHRFCFAPFYFGLVASGQAAQVGAGMAFSTTLSRVFVPFPAPMTTVPTLTFSAVGDFDVLLSNGAGQAVTAISLDATGAQAASVNFNPASGLVAGNGVMVRSQTTSAYLYFSAEI